MKVTCRVTLRRPNRMIDYAIRSEDWPDFVPLPVKGDIVSIEGVDYDLTERTIRPWPHPEDGFASLSLGEQPTDGMEPEAYIAENLPGFTIET